MDEEEDVFLHLCRPRRGGRSGRRRNLLGVMGLFVMLGTLPVPRGPRVPRERLQWEAHAALLVEERRFKDMYRMEVACFSCQCILVDTIDSSLCHNVATRSVLLCFVLSQFTTFCALVEKLRPAIQRDDAMGRLVGGAVSAESQLAIAVRLLAGGSHHDQASLHGVSDATVYEILHRVVQAINGSDVGPVRWPAASELRQVADKFLAAQRPPQLFHDCVGAVDGLFVSIICPSQAQDPNQRRYYSAAKGCFGFNLQAVVDSDLAIRAFNLQTPGNTNDYLAWKLSGIEKLVRSLPAPYYVLGDPAYPCSPTVMTTFAGRGLPWEKDAFNFHHSQVRNTVERTFGVLKKRWQILCHDMAFDPENVRRIVRALLQLHNFCMLVRDNPGEEEAEAVTDHRHEILSELPEFDGGRGHSANCPQHVRIIEGIRQSNIRRPVRGHQDNQARGTTFK